MDHRRLRQAGGLERYIFSRESYVRHDSLNFILAVGLDTNTCSIRLTYRKTLLR